MKESHKRFCEKYFETLNASESALYAGYSKKTYAVIGHDLLRRPDVIEYLSKLRAKEAKKHNITKERLIEEYAKIAFFDIRDIYNQDGNLVSIKDIDNNSAGAIASIKSFEEYETDKSGSKILIGTNKEIRVFDKIRALQDLGKHLGLFEKDNDQKKVSVIGIMSTERIKEISNELEDEV